MSIRKESKEQRGNKRDGERERERGIEERNTGGSDAVTVVQMGF